MLKRAADTFADKTRGSQIIEAARAFYVSTDELLRRHSGFFSFFLKEFLLFGRPIRWLDLDG